MRKIEVMDARTIVIGRAGENGAAQVVWPGILAKWRGLYGEGTVQLAARRPGDKDPYPAVCEVSGDDVTWVVSAGDTGRAGIGECELSYLVGDTVAKSQTWATMVMKSLTGDGTAEPPEEPAKAWFTAMQEQIGNLDDLTTKAKANLVAAINEAAKTGSGGAGSISMRTADGYIQYSTDGGETWENLIALADLQGPAGAGMNVTGATVGQIAKITAVDDNGKPTAWEPVDMPSGGDETSTVGELLMSDEASEVTAFAKEFDAKGYKNFLIIIGGQKNDTATSIREGFLVFGGQKYIICYYTAWLNVTNSSYPNGNIAETVTTISDDLVRIDYVQSITNITLIGRRFQGNSSSLSAPKVGYLIGSATAEESKISLEFNQSVPLVKVEVYGY